MIRRKRRYDIEKSSTMSSEILRNLYINLYGELSKYIWDFPTVEKLANLEIECYKLFPDTNVVRNSLEYLKRAAHTVLTDLKDEELLETFEDFETILGYGDKDFIYPVQYAKEVVTNEDS